MKDKGVKIKETVKKLKTAAFYGGLVCELLVSPSGFASGGFMNQALIFIGIALMFFAAVAELDIKKDLLLYAAVFAFSGVFLLLTSSALMLRLGLVLLAGRREDAGKVMKLYGTAHRIYTDTCAAGPWRGDICGRSVQACQGAALHVRLYPSQCFQLLLV